MWRSASGEQKKKAHKYNTIIRSQIDEVSRWHIKMRCDHLICVCVLGTGWKWNPLSLAFSMRNSHPEYPDAHREWARAKIRLRYLDIYGEQTREWERERERVYCAGLCVLQSISKLPYLERYVSFVSVVHNNDNDNNIHTIQNVNTVFLAGSLIIFVYVFVLRNLHAYRSTSKRKCRN